MTSTSASNPAAMPDPETTLMGLARLTTMAFRGIDLMPLAHRMIDRAAQSDRDANALMDLSTILFLRDLKGEGLAVQHQALQAQRCYELPPALPKAIRMLAIMTPGDLMTNAPLPFLFENSDVALTMLYVQPGEALPRELPEHDVIFVAISQSERTMSLLTELESRLASEPRPILNRPAGIAKTCRAEAYRHLAGIEGLLVPPTVQARRAELAEVIEGKLDLTRLLDGDAFPLIIRPVDSHAGLGLCKAATPTELASYLETSPAEEFFISRFVDYSSHDGLFRKYRVALVDGVPFAAHMGISSHWIIHYLNAGMTQSAEKRAEEERFMRTFDDGFARRHGQALEAIAQRFGLDYLVLDCAETRNGELLLFEADPSSVVHSMDPDDLFPYKRPTMERLYSAFRAMLSRSISAAR